MPGPTKDHQQTCGHPGDVSVSCREDHQFEMMTDPNPNHPSGGSEKSPYTLLEKRDDERPHNSQNLEQETKIEGLTLCEETQLNPEVVGDPHEAPQPT